jgi:hypothetical protein
MHTAEMVNTRGAGHSDGPLSGHMNGVRHNVAVGISPIPPLSPLPPKFQQHGSVQLPGHNYQAYPDRYAPGMPTAYAYQNGRSSFHGSEKSGGSVELARSSSSASAALQTYSTSKDASAYEGKFNNSVPGGKTPSDGLLVHAGADMHLILPPSAFAHFHGLYNAGQVSGRLQPMLVHDNMGQLQQVLDFEVDLSPSVCLRMQQQPYPNIMISATVSGAAGCTPHDACSAVMWLLSQIFPWQPYNQVDPYGRMSHHPSPPLPSAPHASVSMGTTSMPHAPMPITSHAMAPAPWSGDMGRKASPANAVPRLVQVPVEQTPSILECWSSFEGPWTGEMFRDLSSSEDLTWLLPDSPDVVSLPPAWLDVLCRLFDGQRGNLVTSQSARHAGDKVLSWLHILLRGEAAYIPYFVITLAKLYFVDRRSDINQMMVNEFPEFAEGHTTSASKLRKHQRYCGYKAVIEVMEALPTVLDQIGTNPSVFASNVLCCKIIFGMLLCLAVLHSQTKKTCYFEALHAPSGAPPSTRYLAKQVDAPGLLALWQQIQDNERDFICSVRGAANRRATLSAPSHAARRGGIHATGVDGDAMHSMQSRRPGIRHSPAAGAEADGMDRVLLALAAGAAHLSGNKRHRSNDGTGMDGRDSGSDGDSDREAREDLIESGDEERGEEERGEEEGDL